MFLCQRTLRTHILSYALTCVFKSITTTLISDFNEYKFLLKYDTVYLYDNDMTKKKWH